MRRKWSEMALALGALVVSAAAYAVPPSAEMLSNACAGCHGTSGASAGPSMPSLAGQSKVFFVDAMKKFRSGEREATVMGRLAKGYTDEQLPSIETLTNKLNALGFRLRKVAKCRPQKK